MPKFVSEINGGTMPEYNKTNYELDDFPAWLTPLKKSLELEGVGVGIFNLPAGKGHTFMHTHEEQEEVYIALSGKGIIQIEDETVDMVPGDFIRVSPPTRRAIKADEESPFAGIVVGGIAKGGYPRYKGSRTLIDDGIPDWDNLPPWCVGNEKIAKINERLKAEREAIKAAG